MRKFFFRDKPNGEKIADFIYSDVCKNAAARDSLVDVQLHPVKMRLFVKFKTEQARNLVNEIVQSPQGVF